jgi:hypothetical protein
MMFEMVVEDYGFNHQNRENPIELTADHIDERIGLYIMISGRYIRTPTDITPTRVNSESIVIILLITDTIDPIIDAVIVAHIVSRYGNPISINCLR